MTTQGGKHQDCCLLSWQCCTLIGRSHEDLLTLSVALCSCSSPAEDAQQSIHLIVTDSLEAFLPLAGLLDIAKEKQRLGKQATKLEAEVAGLRKRLSASSVSCDARSSFVTCSPLRVY